MNSAGSVIHIWTLPPTGMSSELWPGVLALDAFQWRWISRSLSHWLLATKGKGARCPTPLKLPWFLSISRRRRKALHHHLLRPMIKGGGESDDAGVLGQPPCRRRRCRGGQRRPMERLASRCMLGWVHRWFAADTWRQPRTWHWSTPLSFRMSHQRMVPALIPRRLLCPWQPRRPH
jgi:hypothetical protein